MVWLNDGVNVKSETGHSTQVLFNEGTLGINIVYIYWEWLKKTVEVVETRICVLYNGNTIDIGIVLEHVWVSLSCEKVTLNIGNRNDTYKQKC